MHIGVVYGKSVVYKIFIPEFRNYVLVILPVEKRKMYRFPKGTAS